MKRAQQKAAHSEGSPQNHSIKWIWVASASPLLRRVDLDFEINPIKSEPREEKQLQRGWSASLSHVR